MERLPFTEGMRNEVIIQRGLRVKYDRALTVAGAKIVEVGTEAGTKAGDIEEAINERTAAIHFLAPGKENFVPLSEVLRIAGRHDVPVIVDAAGQVLPVEKMRNYLSVGSDLVCFGAKYFDGPNSAGILCGRRDLVESAKLQTFICFESRGIRTLGRGMKLDRQEIVATVVALQRWMTMDHEARLKRQHEKVKRLADELNRVPGIKAELAGERLGIATSLHVKLDSKTFGMTPKEAVKALKNMDPEVWVGLKDETIIINADTLVEGDEEIILRSFKQLSSS
jgi:L-seryl-tRNA(Ser) seleniumtransferase